MLHATKASSHTPNFLRRSQSRPQQDQVRTWTILVGAYILVILKLLTLTSRGEQFSISVGTFVTNGVPAPGAGQIEAVNTTDVYTFEATAGQIIFMEEISVAASFQGWLYWELKSPTGVSLASGYFQGNHEGRRVLPQNGTYTLTVKVLTTNPAYVGAYSFRLRDVPPDAVYSVEIGDTITNGVPTAGAGNIEVPGANDIYQFTATNGQLAFFERLQVAPAFEGWLQWELKAPSGASIFRSYFGPGNDGRKTLPETGPYTLRVGDGVASLSHVGTYAFRMRPIPPDQTFPIQIGELVSDGTPGQGAGKIESTGAWDYYTFSGVAGQVLFFDNLSAAPSLGGYLHWEVKTPSGATLFSQYFTATTPGRKTLPETGTYRLRCSVASTDTGLTGSYSFRITSVEDSQFSIRVGELITNGLPALGAGQIEVSGGQDLYTFSATAGQRVNFQELFAAPAFDGWLRWELKSPSSNIVFQGFFQPGQAKKFSLPESGTYRLRVFAGTSNPQYVGAYSFRTWCDVYAVPDRFALSPAGILIVPHGTFLCNDRWEAGDDVAIELPSTNSTAGGTLTLGPAGIVYVPPVGFSGVDTFAYRLRGELGGVSTVVDTVLVEPGADYHPTVVSLNCQAGNMLQICLMGSPNSTCHVQESDDLQSWFNTGSLTADSAGSMIFTSDTSGREKRFYRFLRQ